MPTNTRRSKLLEIVRRKGFASLPELRSELDVSESTIRRDLDHLEDSGEARRTHGGVFYTGPTPKLTHFELRQAENWEKKRTVAKLAATLIDDGSTILLDGGSTTYELAQLIVGRPLQVVTNSLPVATLFASDEAAELILVGGSIHPRTGVSLGPYANAMLAGLHVKQSVLSVAGVAEDGAYNSNPLLVETERAMMAAADEVIVVADSTKFGAKSLARLCPLKAVNAYVTDNELSPAWRERIAACGARLHVAEPAPSGTS